MTVAVVCYDQFNGIWLIEIDSNPPPVAVVYIDSEADGWTMTSSFSCPAITTESLTLPKDTSSSRVKEGTSERKRSRRKSHQKLSKYPGTLAERKTDILQGFPLQDNCHFL